MQKYFQKMAPRQTLLSVLILVLFIMMAVSSFPDRMVTYKGDGVYEEDYISLSKNVHRVTTGTRDDQGRWTGLISIQYVGPHQSYVEEAHMAYGMRQGLSTRIYPDGDREENYYVNDIQINTNKSTQSTLEGHSAYERLILKHPWYIFSLNACDFSSEYIKAFMDTVQTLLDIHTFNIPDFENEFDGVYDEVIDSLTKTPYDSVIVLISKYYISKGLEEMKDAEFRLAVIEHYRSGIPTFEIIDSVFGNYLTDLNGKGINDEDFKNFCDDFDDSLDINGPLNTEDPMFIDSLDNRSFNTLYQFAFPEKSTTRYAMIYQSLNSFPFLKQARGLKTNRYLSTPSEEVLNGILEYFLKGDVLRFIFKETYREKFGLAELPTLATEFSGQNSTTSVSIKGIVISDGGTDVTASGIVWGTSFNPTLDDNVINSEATIGNFTLIISGLTEGTNYYARTYATNILGISYGNCISFSPVEIVSNQKLKSQELNLIMYPNPSDGLITLRYLSDSPGYGILKIYDMNGRNVYTCTLDMGNNEEVIIPLDLTFLSDGVYNCRLENGTDRRMASLVIRR